MTREVLAGEIALGLLDEAESAAALARDPLLAEAVSRWELRLAGIALDGPPTLPAAGSLAAIHRKLDALEAGAAPVLARPAEGLFARLCDSLAFWRGLSAAGLAATATLATLVAIGPRESARPIAERPSGPPPSLAVQAPVLVSPILPRDGGALYVAAYDPGRGRLIVQPAAAEARRGVQILWLSPAEGAEPLALGVLDPSRQVAFDLAPTAARAMSEQASLVLTLEPTPPTGPAVGPILATGKFRAF